MKKKLNIYIHISLWIVYAFLLFVSVNRSFTFQDALIRSTVIVSIHLAIFYANTYYLFPRLIQNKRTWWYLINVLVILILIGVFFQWFDRQFIPEDMQDIMQDRMKRMREKGRAFQSPRKPLHRAQLLFQLLSNLFILLFSSAYAATQIGRKKELQETRSREENLNSEMKFLKSQINPHFLFNSLNNIYALTLSQSEKSSEMILKLSSMLRYILYECNGSFVSVDKEWDYIENFIDFQRLKSEQELNIKTEYNSNARNNDIAPMLLIPFVENAFKHSNIEDHNNGWVHLSLNNTENHIIFQIDNSLGNSEKQKDEHGGIGLENVKRRLELIYPEKAQLIINKKQNSYSVILQIEKESTT